jgi:hypothetical protein
MAARQRVHPRAPATPPTYGRERGRGGHRLAREAPNATKPVRSWLAGVLGALALVPGCAGGPVHHEEGEGPLSANLGTGAMALLEREDRGHSTFGAILCRRDADESLVIDAVEPRAVLGSDLHDVTTLVRRFTYRNEEGHQYVVSALGSPPHLDEIGTIVGDFQPARSAAISIDCDDMWQETAEGEPTGDMEELMIVMDVGPEGGGWDGFEVHYTVDGDPYVLDVDWINVVCGPSVDLPDLCE